MSIAVDHVPGQVYASRSVPAALRVAAWFGEPAVVRAWVILAIALVPIWYILRDESVDPFYPFAFLGGTVQTQGIVTYVDQGEPEKLGTGAGGVAWERVVLYGIEYQYLGRDGVTYTGAASYLGGWPRTANQGPKEYAEVGLPVPVEYAKWNLAKSRVPGMGVAVGTKERVLAWVFWVAGLGVVVSLLGIAAGLLKGRKTSRLLAGGVPAQGELVSAEPLPLLAVFGVRQLTYRFHDGTQTRFCKVWTTEDRVHRSDDAQPLLFNPTRPTSAVVVDQIAGRPTIDRQGNLTEGQGNPYNGLWAPAVCVMGYAWMVLDLLGISSPPGL